ncbi:MAG: HlyD family efflux transporter periplasmic adaptor subunit, partial [Aestuariivirgaceae bacterium]|nr:HlyD family efflux transporter periplasmic adaptor subunit [Aestuariivirgaceae bacterium]
PLIASLFSACTSPDAVISGYVEGEYVSLAPHASARILEVAVRRGERVAPGQIVARLEDEDARLALNEAEARLAQTRAALADLQTGKRPQEIAVIEASLLSAEAEARRAKLERDRVAELFQRGVSSQAALDTARANQDVGQARVAEIKANLEVARMAARSQAITLAQGRVREAEAALATARWQLEQRQVKAQNAGVVDDVLRHPGDMAGPGSPILSVLPDGAVKLRLYAPQALLPQLSEREEVSVSCDGCPDGLKAIVSYVAKEPEFTPPVIYSVERRQKLVYLIEARPADASPYLRPGVIVDARIGP